jgi:hypothetical protein
VGRNTAMAVSPHSEWLDQFEEGNAAGGHAGEVQAIRSPTVSPSMTSRRFPPPWHADPMPGGYGAHLTFGVSFAQPMT